MSQSSNPTRWPLAARPRARFAATVDLPTPPLPLATATMARTPGRPIFASCPACGPAGAALAVAPASFAAARWAVSTARTERTPGIDPTASSACLRMGSDSAPLFGSTSMAKLTTPLSMARPAIMPRLTTSSPRSGSRTVRRASSTCCSDGSVMLECFPLAPTFRIRASTRLTLSSRSDEFACSGQDDI